MGGDNDAAAAPAPVDPAVARRQRSTSHAFFPLFAQLVSSRSEISAELRRQQQRLVDGRGLSAAARLAWEQRKKFVARGRVVCVLVTTLVAFADCRPMRREPRSRRRCARRRRVRWSSPPRRARARRRRSDSLFSTTRSSATKAPHVASSAHNRDVWCAPLCCLSLVSLDEENKQAAIAVAERVAEERGERVGGTIGYRSESNVATRHRCSNDADRQHSSREQAVGGDAFAVLHDGRVVAPSAERRRT